MTLDENLRAALTGNKVGLQNGGFKIDQKLSKISSILNESIQFVPAMKPYQNESTMLKSKYIYINASSVAQNDRVLSQNKPQNGQKFGQFSPNLVKNCSNGAECSGSEPSTSNGYCNSDIQLKNSGPHVPPPQFSIYPLESVRLTWDAQLRQGTAVGLNNLGNTCFLNSVLQVLANTPPLVNFLFSNDHTGGMNCPGRAGFCAVCSLKGHVKRVYLAAKSRQDSISPQFIVQRLRCVMKNHAFGRQEDAHEFLRYFVDSMQFATLYMFKDRKLDLFTKETSAISRIFGGFHKNDITCLYCNSVSTTFDPFLDISLEIKQFSNIENAFQYFTRVETLSSDNAYKCPKCNKKVSARKSYTIHVPPNVLTIQLKRFDHFGKIDKLVGFPEKLNLRPYMSQKQGLPVNYKLYGAVVHSGRSTNSGHYFAFVRNPLDQWHLMDDSRVCVVNAKAVLQSSAYLLFYVRIPLQMATVKPQPQRVVPNTVGPKPILLVPPSNSSISVEKPTPPIEKTCPPVQAVAPLPFVPRSVQPRVSTTTISQATDSNSTPANQENSSTVTQTRENTTDVPENHNVIDTVPKSETATLISFNNEISVKKLENKQEKLPIDQNLVENPEKSVGPEQKIDQPSISDSASHVTTEIANQETTENAKNGEKVAKNEEKLAKNDEKLAKNEEKREKLSKKRHHSPSEEGVQSKKRHVTHSQDHKSRDKREKSRDKREKSPSAEQPDQKKRRLCSEIAEKSPESHHSHKKKRKTSHVTHRRKSRDHSPKSRDHSPVEKQRKKVKKTKKKKEKLKNQDHHGNGEHRSSFRESAEHSSVVNDSAEHSKNDHKSRRELRKEKKKLRKLHKNEEKFVKNDEKSAKNEEKATKNFGNLVQKITKPVLTPLEFLKKYCAPVKTWEIIQEGQESSKNDGQNLKNGQKNLHNGSTEYRNQKFSNNFDNEKQKNDSWNDELDAGKIKKVKNKNRHYRYNESGGNMFQKAQDMKNHNAVLV